MNLVGATTILKTPAGTSHRLEIRKRSEVISHRDPIHRLPAETQMIFENGAGAISMRITQVS